MPTLTALQVEVVLGLIQAEILAAAALWRRADRQAALKEQGAPYSLGSSIITPAMQRAYRENLSARAPEYQARVAKLEALAAALTG